MRFVWKKLCNISVCMWLIFLVKLWMFVFALAYVVFAISFLQSSSNNYAGVCMFAMPLPTEYVLSKIENSIMRAIYFPFVDDAWRIIAAKLLQIRHGCILQLCLQNWYDTLQLQTLAVMFLSGSLVTSSWLVLRLRVNPSPIYGRFLRISSHGQPARAGPRAWEGELLVPHHNDTACSEIEVLEPSTQHRIKSIQITVV
jgi:hypothetical protein